MRGYTLVEILAVIFVLGIIVLVTFPNLLNTYQNTEQKRYEEFVYTIKLTAEVYIESNEELFTLNAPADFVIITIGDLVTAGLYNQKTNDPLTNQPVVLESEIKVVVQANLVKEYIYPYEGE